MQKFWLTLQKKTQDQSLRVGETAEDPVGADFESTANLYISICTRPIGRETRVARPLLKTPKTKTTGWHPRWRGCAAELTNGLSSTEFVVRNRAQHYEKAHFPMSTSG